MSYIVEGILKETAGGRYFVVDEMGARYDCTVGFPLTVEEHGQWIEGTVEFEQNRGYLLRFSDGHSLALSAGWHVRGSSIE